MWLFQWFHRMAFFSFFFLKKKVKKNSLTKRVLSFRFLQKGKNKIFNKKKFVWVTESACHPSQCAGGVECAARQRAVRQHCVASYVTTGAGAGAGGSSLYSLSSSSVIPNMRSGEEHILPLPLSHSSTLCSPTLWTACPGPPWSPHDN